MRRLLTHLAAERLVGFQLGAILFDAFHGAFVATASLGGLSQCSAQQAAAQRTIWNQAQST
jgi:hypothetical protein